MEKRNIIIRYFVILMVIATVVACASTPKQESTGEIRGRFGYHDQGKISACR